MGNIFESLPKEIFCDNIFSFLMLADIASLSCVNSKSKALCNSNMMWENIVFQKFNGRERIFDIVDFFIPTHPKHEREGERNWKYITKILTLATKVLEFDTIFHNIVYNLNVNRLLDIITFFEMFPYFKTEEVERKVKNLSQREFIEYLCKIEQLKEQCCRKKINGRNAVYRGYCRKGVFHGKGSLNYVDEGNVYEGDFKDGIPHGKGKRTYVDGAVYEGEWKNGVFDGTGKLTKGSDSYEGEFKKGIPHGKGIITRNELGDLHETELKEGKKHGKGRSFFSYCSVRKKHLDVFIGDFKHNWKHGRFEHDGDVKFTLEGTWDARKNIHGMFYNEFVGKLLDGKGNVVEEGIWINQENEKFEKNGKNERIYEELNKNVEALRKRWLEWKNSTIKKKASRPQRDVKY